MEHSDRHNSLHICWRIVRTDSSVSIANWSYRLFYSFLAASRNCSLPARECLNRSCSILVGRFSLIHFVHRTQPERTVTCLQTSVMPFQTKHFQTAIRLTRGYTTVIIQSLELCSVMVWSVYGKNDNRNLSAVMIPFKVPISPFLCWFDMKGIHRKTNFE